MASSGMLRRVVLVRTYFIRVTRIGELGTRLAVTSNRRITRATRPNIPEDAILHSDRHENLKFYIVLTGWTL
jgi:hypothetical protein